MQHKEALPVGTILDSGIRQYSINSVLGQGGFGITYLATAKVLVDNIPFEVPFAIKEHYISSMNERQGTSVSISNVNNTEEIKESIDSFLVEAQRLNKLSLNHPGIVRVNENFRANGTAYYVMEYVKGKSLREHVKQSPLGRLPEAEALQLFRPVAETIGYLHKNHVTHLDIKPDNILIRENGEPVVIDFGLSKHYSSKGTPTSTIKAAGCSAGYSPMEQYVGITSFTPEADIYALGATLLYMLTGKDPVVSTEINSDIICRSLPEGVSDKTTTAIVSAMEKLKENRPHSVEEWLNKMESHQQDAPKSEEEANQENHHNSTRKISVKQTAKPFSFIFDYLWRKFKSVAVFALGAFLVAYGVNYVINRCSQPQGETSEPRKETAIRVENFKYTVPEIGTGLYTGLLDADSLPHDTKAKIFFAEDNVYEGAFVHGKLEGTGIVYTIAGQTFEGSFKNNQFDEGKLTTRDGQYFKGTFRDKQPYNGAWYDTNGNVISRLEDGQYK